MQSSSRRNTSLSKSQQAARGDDLATGIPRTPKPLTKVRKQREGWSPLMVDDLPAHLPILEAEITLLEANCLDIASAILDHSDGT